MPRFRLGTTSFIYRAGWRENVARLANRVQDIELLFFEAAKPSDLPDAAELRALAELRAAHRLSYSVHTPLDASLASEDRTLRRDSVASVLRVIEATRTLEPEAYVLHVYLGDCEHDPRKPTDLDAWRERAAESIEKLLASGVASQRLCVESIDYDLALIAPLVERYDLSLALDIGHLHRDGRPLYAFIDQYLGRTKLVQWHGTDPEDRDHRSLAHYPAIEARWLLRTLAERDFGGVLTLEVFREDDFETSWSLVQGWLSDPGSIGKRMNERGKIVLIGGGVRCGKSRFALARARDLGETRVFVATAEGLDDEMRKRIDNHARERGPDFRTVEAPRELCAALRSIVRADVVVIDCITLWISNLLLSGASPADIAAEVDALVSELSTRRFHSVLVTNEVGMGVVPDNALGRQFRDACGAAHQALSRAADEIYFGALGALLRLRPEPFGLAWPSP